MVAHVSDIACVNSLGECALTLAAKNGHIDVIAWFLQVLPNRVDFQARDGTTPLYSAVIHKRLEAARLLLEHKASINTTDRARNSMLHIACAHGAMPLVDLCLRYGASSNVLNNSDESPLMVAKTSDVCRAILGMPPCCHSLRRRSPLTLLPCRVPQRGAAP